MTVKRGRRATRLSDDRIDLDLKASEESSILLQLSDELQSIIRDALAYFEVPQRTPESQAVRALRKSSCNRTSGSVLKELNRLGELTLAWKTDPAFLDSDGFPRVLGINGRGATFSRLASRFFPKKGTSFVVHLARRYADVALINGNKIALLGGSVVNIAPSRRSALAHLVRQVDQLISTCTHNQTVSRTGVGLARFERMCHAVIPKSEFDAVMNELRPQLDEVCERAASILRQRYRSLPRSQTTVASIGIIASKCDDLARAGYGSANCQYRVVKQRNRGDLVKKPASGAAL